MSETPSVIVNSTDTENTTSVKQIHSSDTQIYEFSTLLARGERYIRCFNSHEEKTISASDTVTSITGTKNIRAFQNKLIC